MRSQTRAIGAALACVVLLNCNDATQRPDFDAPGRNPAALMTRNGEVHVVYLDPATRRLMHRRLAESQSTFVSPASDTIDLRGENTPLFTQRNDDSLLVIYPAVVPGGSGHHAKSELRAQLSRDAGRTWSPPLRVDGDIAARSHNFADFAVAPNGDVVFSWLDSRAGKQGVQTAVLRSDLRVSAAQTADPKTCQCCRTALYASSNGEIWLAYRDLADGNVRNMAYAVARGAGQPFVARGDVADDRWSVNGCPESGPRFAQTAERTMWLAWFNGASNAIELAAAPRGSRFVRRGIVPNGNHPDLGVLPDGRLIIVYEVLRGGARAIEARVSDVTHAHLSAAIPIAAEGESPRYVPNGEGALISYTMHVGNTPHVRVIDPFSGMEAP